MRSTTRPRTSIFKGLLERSRRCWSNRKKPETRAEFGKPQWELGSGTYSFASPELIACSYVEGGVWKISMLHIESETLLAIDTPFSEMGRGDIQAGDGKVVFIGGPP